MQAAILAGGKSQRLKRSLPLLTHKAFLKIGSQTLLERVLSKLNLEFNEIALITDRPEIFDLNIKIKKYKDLFHSAGPIGGIYTSLFYSSTFHVFVFASDMPFLNPKLIRYFKENSFNYDVVTPLVKGEAEPLFSIYSKNCLYWIEKLIEKEDFKIVNFFPNVSVKYIFEDEIKKIDPTLNSFFNINTFEDFKRSQKIEEFLGY